MEVVQDGVPLQNVDLMFGRRYWNGYQTNLRYLPTLLVLVNALDAHACGDASNPRGTVNRYGSTELPSPFAVYQCHRSTNENEWLPAFEFTTSPRSLCVVSSRSQLFFFKSDFYPGQRKLWRPAVLYSSHHIATLRREIGPNDSPKQICNPPRK